MALLSLNNLSVAPLDSFTADIEEKDIIAISGESGSGKSRLLYSIADLIPHEGLLTFKNNTLDQYSPNIWRRQVMLLPSRIEWWENTAREHFISNTISLSKLHLNEKSLDQPITELSTGQKQRLAILRALDRSPSILLLDEPTANLDHQNTLAVEHLIKEWVRTDSRAVIWCSHDQDQIQRVANKIWTIENHQVIENSL